jgi:hypothetical protein
MSLSKAYVNGRCTSKPQLVRSFPEVRRFINCCSSALVVSDIGINMDQLCKIGNFHDQ